MVRRRRQRQWICRLQPRSVLLVLVSLACSISLLQWVLQRTGAVTTVMVQQQTAQTADLDGRQQQQHRLAFGLAMHGSLADSEKQVKASQLAKRLTDHLRPRHQAASASPLDLPEDFGSASFNPKHLTARQESLLNAALARQTQHSINSMAELEAKKHERASARKTARLHMLEEHSRLQTYMSSPAYTAWQHERRQNMSRRGIMIAAGGPIQLASAYAMLKTLRYHLKCRLPVELFHQGSSEVDNATMKYFVSQLSGVKFIDGTLEPFPGHQRRVTPYEHAGWAFKVFALYRTTFQQVLLLDADNMPLKSPEYLFETPGFQQHGSLFWPDYWDKDWMNPTPAYRLLNATSPWTEQPDLLTTESGQFLLDRDRHVDALEWILYLNMYGDILYNYVLGDKDLYRLAFTLAGQGQHFCQVEHRPADALVSSGKRKVPQYKQGALVQVDTYRHAGMLQLDLDGGMAFFHRTSDAKLNPDETYSTNYHLADFITVPLTAPRAANVLGGSLIYGPTGISTELTKKCETLNASYLQLVAQCHLNVSSTMMPIPVWPLKSFSELAQVLSHAFEGFLEVQALYLRSRIGLGRNMA